MNKQDVEYLRKREKEQEAYEKQLDNMYQHFILAWNKNPNEKVETPGFARKESTVMEVVMDHFDTPGCEKDLQVMLEIIAAHSQGKQMSVTARTLIEKIANEYAVFHAGDHEE